MECKEINMQKADGYGVEEIDVIVEDLKDRNIYSSNLVYRGFNGRKLEAVLRDGSDTKGNIFGSLESEIRDPFQISRNQNPFDFATDFEHPCLAVFDGLKLRRIGRSYEYQFVSPDDKKGALVAVYELKY